MIEGVEREPVESESRRRKGGKDSFREVVRKGKVTARQRRETGEAKKERHGEELGAL